MPARRVPLELREVQRLGDDALAHERRVPVNEERHRALALASIDLGAHAAFDDRVDELEVARVEREREVKLATGLRDDFARVTEVVLHVAGADESLRLLVVERSEDLAHVLAHHVDEHVEAPAVGHADDELLDAVLPGRLDEQIDHRDHALGSFERETLGADVVLVNELLEDLRLGQLREDANELGAVERSVVTRRFHLLLEPLARLRVFDVRELDAD